LIIFFWSPLQKHPGQRIGTGLHKRTQPQSTAPTATSTATSTATAMDRRAFGHLIDLIAHFPFSRTTQKHKGRLIEHSFLFSHRITKYYRKKR
jgi:hypothetical protein